MHAQDINLPRPDKHQTTELVAFLQQLLITHEEYNRRAIQQRQRLPAGKKGAAGASGGLKAICNHYILRHIVAACILEGGLQQALNIITMSTVVSLDCSYPGIL